MLQVVSNDCTQSIQPCVHTGFPTHQPDPLPTFLCPVCLGCRRQFLPPFLRLRHRNPPASSLCPRSEPGCRGAAPAAIPPPTSAGVCKFLSAPFAHFLHMCLIHRQQIAKPAATGFASLFPCQWSSAKRALFRWKLLRRVRFVILLPPFYPTWITAKSSLVSCSPFHLKFFPAVRTDLFWLRSLSSFFYYFFPMVFDPALVTAKTSPPPWPAIILFHDVSTRRADIYWHLIVSFGVIVPVPASGAAVFLTCDVARWYKLLSTIHTLSFFCYSYPPFLHSTMGG